MKINIITHNFKKATRFLNISLLFFCLFMIIIFVSSMFANSKFMESVISIFIFASGITILISVFLLILRQIFKKVIEVNENQIEALYINSQVNVSQIKEKAEIAYFGNSLKIINDQKDYELNNKTTFELFKNNSTITTTNTSVEIKELDIPPKEILMSIAGAFYG